MEEKQDHQKIHMTHSSDALHAAAGACLILARRADVSSREKGVPLAGSGITARIPLRPPQKPMT